MGIAKMLVSPFLSVLYLVYSLFLLVILRKNQTIPNFLKRSLILSAFEFKALERAVFAFFSPMYSCNLFTDTKNRLFSGVGGVFRF